MHVVFVWLSTAGALGLRPSLAGWPCWSVPLRHRTINPPRHGPDAGSPPARRAGARAAWDRRRDSWRRRGQRRGLRVLFYDFRWWWAAILLGLTLLRADGCAGGPVRRRVAAWALVGRRTPLAADAVVSLASWLGQSRRRLLSIHRQPSRRRAEVRPLLRGVVSGRRSRHLAVRPGSGAAADARRALLRNGASSRRIRADARSSIATPASCRNPVAFRGTAFAVSRASSREGTAASRNHQPGTAVCFFPGYLLDRYLLTFKASADGEFPSELPMTNVMMVLMYGNCAVLLFRLLAGRSDRTGLPVVGRPSGC